MSFTRYCLTLAKTLPCNHSAQSVYNRRCIAALAGGATDSCGIPLNPTWSVYELLSSYPKPVLSPATLKHIHELSALIPPEEGRPEYDRLQQELGDLIKLVEAVKLVNTDSVQPPSRHYEDNWDKGTDTRTESDENTGQSLLSHASRTTNGFYVVDVDRKR
ncbi:hypothetical protein JOM56_008330 [Amanita muscaria]